MGKISKLRLTIPQPHSRPKEEGVNAEELAILTGDHKKSTKQKHSKKKQS